MLQNPDAFVMKRVRKIASSSYAHAAYVAASCQTRLLQSKILGNDVDSLTPSISAKLDIFKATNHKGHPYSTVYGN